MIKIQTLSILVTSIVTEAPDCDVPPEEVGAVPEVLGTVGGTTFKVVVLLIALAIPEARAKVLFLTKCLIRLKLLNQNHYL